MRDLGFLLLGVGIGLLWRAWQWGRYRRVAHPNR